MARRRLGTVGFRSDMDDYRCEIPGSSHRLLVLRIPCGNDGLAGLLEVRLHFFHFGRPKVTDTHSLSRDPRSTIQFVGISAFHTRISDPLIGGTYMTVRFVPEIFVSIILCILCMRNVYRTDSANI